MQGLYLITNDDPFPILQQKLNAALATRQVRLLQYRRKKVTKTQQYHEIEQLLPLCRQYDVPFIINDDVQQAKHFAVHVHLGQDDGSIVEARQLLGQQAIIGRTCLNDVRLAQQAVADGADYVAFGAIYSSITKPEAGNIGLQVLAQAKQQFKVPICAIGGLTVENSAAVIAAGASLCAVVSDILARPVEQIPARVEAWAQLFLAN